MERDKRFALFSKGRKRSILLHILISHNVRNVQTNTLRTQTRVEPNALACNYLLRLPNEVTKLSTQRQSPIARPIPANVIINSPNTLRSVAEYEPAVPLVPWCVFHKYCLC